MENKNNYNHSKDFKNECLQAIIKIKQFFATANNDKETEYITSKQMPPECDTKLADDKFRRIVLAEHGFDLVLNHIDAFDIPDVCDGFMPQMANTSSDADETKE